MDSKTTIEITDYKNFVNTITSKPSTNLDCLISRLNELQDQGVNVPQLMTSAYGISSESGEFTELVKKIIFQGKPYTEDNVRHLKIELSDILFYFQLACIALDTTIEEIMQINFEKLSSRYPEGTFTINRSENRREGDL